MNTPIFTPALCQLRNQQEPAGGCRSGRNNHLHHYGHQPGAFLATGLVVTDTLNGAALVVPGPTTIDAGATAVYHFSYTITEADCNTGLANLAEVSGDNGAWTVIPDAVYTPVQCQSYLWLPLIRQPGQ
jgi:hypothetical protein